MSSSSIGSQLSNLYLLGLLRQKLNDTQAQISTGKKGNMLADLGGSGASSAISFRNSMSKISSYTSNLNTVKTRISTMDKAMQSVADTARDTLSMLRSQLQNQTPLDDITRNDAAENLRAVISRMNVTVDGRYLFAGSDIQNAPLSDESALQGNVSSAISSLMSGSPSKDDVVNAMKGITGADLGYSSGSLAADPVTVRADDNREIDYTVMAHNSGFRDILRGLALVSNLPTPTTPEETEKYWSMVNGAIDLLDQGAKGVDNAQGVLGSRGRAVTDLLAEHEDMSLTMENYIGSVEDIDIADASTRLQQLSAQLQISYQVTASLKDLSLINFI